MMSHATGAILVTMLVSSASVFAEDRGQNFLRGGGEIQLKERPLPARHDQCGFCHLKKSRFFIPKKKKLQREHEVLSTRHGNVEMSCNNCHDANHSNRLRSTKMFPADFSNASPVCRRCHAEVFEDWTRGVHGKRIGGWNLPQTQFHCVDCHDPHSVKFKQMDAIATPRKPQIGGGSQRAAAH